MKMEPLKNGSLKIWMSDWDMQRWGLQFEHMGAHDEATRRAMLRLISVARDRHLLHPNGDLTLEALPLGNGCLLLVTPNRREPLLALPQPLVYHLRNADDLLQLTDGLRRLPARHLPAASLFAWPTGYRLIVYPHGTKHHTVCCRLLCEYAQPITDPLAIAHTEEHGTALCIGDAFQRLQITAPATGQPTPPDRPH